MQALQLGVSGAAARPRATESLHNGLFKLPILLPARSLSCVHIMALLVHDEASYSHVTSETTPGSAAEQLSRGGTLLHQASYSHSTHHAAISADASQSARHTVGPDSVSHSPRLTGPAIWYRRWEL